jgi:hypothetical protein
MGSTTLRWKIGITRFSESGVRGEERGERREGRGAWRENFLRKV